MRLIVTLLNTEDPPNNNEFAINQWSEMTKKNSIKPNIKWKHEPELKLTKFYATVEPYRH